MIAIETKNITKKLRGHCILNDVSFTVYQNNHIGIIGQNGSGKRMLFKVLSGILLPDSGTVTVWGSSVDKKKFPNDFGCLIEHPGMLPQYSGIENLCLLANIQKKCKKQDIAELMSRMGLNPCDKRPVRKYSLGMRQKLGIIQAIMDKPKLLILDEPINNLDAESVDIVRNIIKDLQAVEKTTTVISSHNTEDIDQLCDCTYKMMDGVLRKV